MPSKAIIGVDESGKGDFFGPLVVASFLADDKDSDKLRSLGVKDGKTLSVKRTHEIADLLKGLYPYSLVIFMPKVYNKLYEKIKNLNKLLAEGHAEAIVDILKNNKASSAISDKFGKPELLEKALSSKKCSIDLKQIVRGESHIQVAAASIIARSEFILKIEQLSDEYGVELLRGASSQVDIAGQRFVNEHGLKMLSKVAKLHFKNYQRVIKPDLFV